MSVRWTLFLVAAVAMAAERPAAIARGYLQKVRETANFDYLERAAKIVEKLLAADPGDGEALKLRTEIALERHEFADAVEYSEAMVLIAPRDPFHWGTLGDASMERGDYDRARQAYDRMVALRPNLDSLNRWSFYLWVTGKPEEAIAAMRQAVAGPVEKPEHLAWCLVDLGNMQFKLGRLDDAAASFRGALKAFDGYYPAHAGLGRVAGARGQWAEAKSRFERAYRAVPLAEYAYALAAIEPKSKAGQVDRIELVDTMNRAGGEKTDRSLALIRANLGRDLGRARELIEAELTVREDVYTYDALAWILWKQGETVKAAEAMRKAVRFDTAEPLFAYHAARVLPEERVKWERRLAELNPKFDPMLWRE